MSQRVDLNRPAREADQVNVSIVLADANSAHECLDRALESQEAQHVKRHIDTARRILTSMDSVLAQIEPGTGLLKQAGAAKIQLQERLCEIEEIE